MSIIRLEKVLRVQISKGNIGRCFRSRDAHDINRTHEALTLEHDLNGEEGFHVSWV